MVSRREVGAVLVLGLLGLACLLLGTRVARADDVMVRARPASGVERRLEFSDLVLEEALRRTVKKYGPYRIEWVTAVLARERMLLELVSGEVYNTSVMASQPSWEAQLLPIWIPLDMGLSNYRIALTHRDAQEKIAAVRTLDELKALRVGLGAGWSSRRVMDFNQFNVVLGESFEPLLKMLMAGRIDYFPRGMNEVFVEFDDRASANPDLVIERSVVIDFPLPGYVFVSPKAPRLHKRLTEGMEAMVRDGSLRKMVSEYHAEMIKRANFCERQVFRIENPFLSEKTPLKRKELWFNPYDPKTGICAVKVRKPVKK
ncbi:transporter substrate-binding domain-containing protein [Uliginosibacterium sp. 31-16]|uniref:substrate-binding periplasmic protein n=1 Tax=Uliginosibacterium sp. 31-16 TaxID=3068315 RepID=UPI00273DBB6A|nr:transporter substrate-binding domain-containing protein [Uliginosibacterium sp. 31-16]MDP5239731.1 transporter substrate-binding domain-containing protein [Uliginosibacterium sp. 31-16]